MLNLKTIILFEEKKIQKFNTIWVRLYSFMFGMSGFATLIHTVMYLISPLARLKHTVLALAHKARSFVKKI